MPFKITTSGTNIDWNDGDKKVSDKCRTEQFQTVCLHTELQINCSAKNQDVSSKKKTINYLLDRTITNRKMDRKYLFFALKKSYFVPEDKNVQIQ